MAENRQNVDLAGGNRTHDLRCIDHDQIRFSSHLAKKHFFLLLELPVYLGLYNPINRPCNRILPYERVRPMVRIYYIPLGFSAGYTGPNPPGALAFRSFQVVEDRIRLREIESAKNGGGELTGKAEGENGEGPRNGQTEQGMYRTKIMAFLDFLLALEGEDKLSKTQVREQVDAFMFGGGRRRGEEG